MSVSLNASCLRRHFRSALFLLCLFSQPAFLRGQQVANPAAIHEKGSAPVRNFGVKEYGGEAQSFAMESGPAGVLYFGNGAGILEYDGQEWRIIKTPNGSACISLKKIDKTIYTGAQNEIGRLAYDSTGATYFEPLTHLVAAPYRNFREVWNIIPYEGKVVFKTVSSLLVFDGQKIEVVPAPAPFTREFLFHDDRLIVQLQSGEVLQLSPQSLEPYEPLHMLSPYRVTLFRPLADGEFLVGTYGNGLFKLGPDDTLKPILSPLSEFLRESYLYRWCELPGGRLALATFRGGVVVVDGSLHLHDRIDEQAGLQNQSLWSVTMDPGGNLWMMTDNGISRSEVGAPFSYYDKKDGLHGTIQDMIRYQDRLYATTNFGIFRLKPGSHSDPARFHSKWELLPGSDAKAWFLARHNGHLLITSENGVLVFDTHTLKYISDLPSRAILASESTPFIFVGFTDGLGVFSSDYRFLGRMPGVNVEIRSMQEDTAGNLWLGTFVDGVIKVELNPEHPLQSEVVQLGLADGLSHTNDNEVFKVGGQIVLATPGGLKTPAEGGKIVPYNKLGAGYSSGERWVYRMKEEIGAGVWLSAYNLTELTFAENSGEYSRKLFRLLSEFPVYSILPEQQYAWFGGTEGVVRYQKTSVSKPGPHAAIRKITVNDDSVVYAGNVAPIALSLSSSFKNIRFQVSSTALSHEEKNTFQFHLEGFDEAWSPWTNENFRVYSSLPAGKYTFRCRTSDVFGNTSEPATYSFYVAPPWYMEPYLLVPALLLLGYFLVIIVRYFSTRKLIRRVEELEVMQRIQKERERISSDLHDHVGAQLTSIIAGLQITEQIEDFQYNPRVRQIIDSLKEDASQTMTNLRDSIWSLHYKEVSVAGLAEHLDNYFTNQLKYFPDISFSLRLKGDKAVVISPTAALHLIRAVQEAFQNVLKHAGASAITLLVHAKEGLLILELSDNGKGFDATKIEKEHYGLDNMKRRMEELSGEFTLESGRTGTKVRFEVPLEKIMA